MTARLWSARGLTYLFALLLAVFLGGELAALTAPEPHRETSGPLPPDRAFVAFYAAGRLVLAGASKELYSISRQQEEIVQLKGYQRFPLPFTYPAFFAMLLAPVSALPYSVALGTWMVLMVVALAASVLLLRRVSPAVHRYPVLFGMGMLAFLPMLWSIFDGLSVPLTLLCLAGAYQALVRNRSLQAGVWLGILLYKPQLALPMMALLAWRRQWRVVLMAGVTGAALSALAMALVAPGWPVAFMKIILNKDYHANERACCGAYHASLPALVAFTFPGQRVPLLVVGLTGIIAVGITLRLWRRVHSPDSCFPMLFGLGLSVAIAWSPHALFYETSLLIIPVIALVDAWRKEAGNTTVAQRLSGKQQLLLAGLMVGGMMWPLVRVIGIQPMVLSPLIVGAMCWHQLRKTSDWARAEALNPLPMDSRRDGRADEGIRAPVAERRAS